MQQSGHYEQQGELFGLEAYEETRSLIATRDWLFMEALTHSYSAVKHDTGIGGTMDFLDRSFRR